MCFFRRVSFSNGEEGEKDGVGAVSVPRRCYGHRMIVLNIYGWAGTADGWNQMERRQHSRANFIDNLNAKVERVRMTKRVGDEHSVSYGEV